MEDSRGYSLKLYRENKSAPINMIGVQLGRMCIDEGISVAFVVEYFGVSKPTIYSWFCGRSNPHKRHHKAIRYMLEHGGLDAGV